MDSQQAALTTAPAAPGFWAAADMAAWAADALALPPTDAWANALVLEGLVEAMPLKGGRTDHMLADAAGKSEG